MCAASPPRRPATCSPRTSHQVATHTWFECVCVSGRCVHGWTTFPNSTRTRRDPSTAAADRIGDKFQSVRGGGTAKAQKWRRYSQSNTGASARALLKQPAPKRPTRDAPRAWGSGLSRGRSHRGQIPVGAGGVGGARAVMAKVLAKQYRRVGARSAEATGTQTAYPRCASCLGQS